MLWTVNPDAGTIATPTSEFTIWTPPTVAADTVYTFTCTATDAGGLTGSDTAMATVSPAPLTTRKIYLGPTAVAGVFLGAVAQQVYLGSTLLFGGASATPTPSYTEFFGSVAARDDCETAARFETTGTTQERKYRAYPGSTNLTGTVLEEYLASDAFSEIPIARGLELLVTPGPLCAFRLRQRVGDNEVGANQELNRSWSNWTTQRAGAGIYVIDVTNSEYMVLRPNDRNGGSDGGSFINWSDTSGGASGFWDVCIQHSSFASNAAYRTWAIDEVRDVGSVVEIIVAILSDTAYIPDFT